MREKGKLVPPGGRTVSMGQNVLEGPDGKYGSDGGDEDAG